MYWYQYTALPIYIAGQLRCTGLLICIAGQLRCTALPICIAGQLRNLLNENIVLSYCPRCAIISDVDRWISNMLVHVLVPAHSSTDELCMFPPFLYSLTQPFASVYAKIFDFCSRGTTAPYVECPCSYTMHQNPSSSNQRFHFSSTTTSYSI